MISEFLNTLYVMQDGARVRLDHDSLRVEVEGEQALQVPILHLGGLCVFGSVSVSSGVIRRFCEDGRGITFMSRSGSFVGRVVGPVSGNVLLRQAQYRAIDDADLCRSIARAVVAGKLQNSRSLLQRSVRDASQKRSVERLQAAVDALATSIGTLPDTNDIDAMRGIEGEGARKVFSVFDLMFTRQRDDFRVVGRTRRPPLDRTNALLSFFFALLAKDCTGALEAAGLDPQAGFFHTLRPGRPALSLDLMEEMRPVLGDRLVVTLVNRAQVTADHFTTRPGGSVSLTDAGRKAAVVAYQSRKADEVMHSVLNRKVPLGLVPHVQARMLARMLRGDLDAYVPFRMK